MPPPLSLTVEPPIVSLPSPARKSAKTSGSLQQRLGAAVFGRLYRNNLVYNICWEDPALDHVALALEPHHRVLVITSAGCNALDYALAGPREVLAVDANPRQNALLELKLAAIRTLPFDDVFALFGRGHHPAFATLYRTRLREALPATAAAFWDRKASWFSARSPLHHHGLCGLFARIMRTAFRLRPSLWREVQALFHFTSTTEQAAHYDQQVRPFLWTPAVRALLSNPSLLALIGVPEAQRQLLVAHHRDGVAGFIADALDTLCRTVPMRENYFWYLYTFGEFSRTCCPRYLTPEGFARLKGGLVDRVSTHTCLVTELLEKQTVPINRFVLLDHLDWMDGHDPVGLEEEWTALRDCAAPGARVLFRSAHSRPPFMDTLRVGAERLRLDQWVRFDESLATELHRRDRVQTYASFHIGTLR